MNEDSSIALKPTKNSFLKLVSTVQEDIKERNKSYLPDKAKADIPNNEHSLDEENDLDFLKRNTSWNVNQTTFQASQFRGNYVWIHGPRGNGKSTIIQQRINQYKSEKQMSRYCY